NPRYTLLDDFNAEKFELYKSPEEGEYAIRGGSFCAIVHIAIDIVLPPEMVLIYIQPVAI
ncbi:hypothetical protein AAULR_25356, partial [Lacticaseibacillus rhamnosus MTCC 5462]